MRPGARIAAALVAVLAACGSEPSADPSVAARDRAGTLRGSDVAAPTTPPTKVVSPSEAAAARRRARSISRASPTEERRAAAPAEVAVEDGEPPPPGVDAPVERDLPAELRERFGDPRSCLTGESPTSLGAELRIDVTVWVTAVGRVTRASIGGNAPASARDCLRARAEAISLPPAIPNAPRPVTTSLRYTVEPAAAP